MVYSMCLSAKQLLEYLEVCYLKILRDLVLVIEVY